MSFSEGRFIRKKKSTNQTKTEWKKFNYTIVVILWEEEGDKNEHITSFFFIRLLPLLTFHIFFVGNEGGIVLPKYTGRNEKKR